MARDTPSVALPKYVQISEMLIRDIAAGRLADGARLPPEREMAEQLAISVGTLRKALRTLEEKGLLNRIQGSGNYIRAGGDLSSVYAMLRLELKDGIGMPTAEVLSVDRLPKPEGAPYFGAAATGWRFRRLRFLSGIPAAMEEIWLDGGRAAEIDPRGLSESLYFFYRERLGLTILAVEDRINLAPVPDWADPRFPLAPGRLAGHVARLARDTAGAPVEISRTWYDPARVDYVSRTGKA